MSTQHPKPTTAALPHPGVSPSQEEDFATQVRAEYAKYLEKRDAIRKASGRIRRTVLNQALLS